MSKLRRDLRLAMAGACSGLFSVSVFLLGYRIVAYYDYLAIREADAYEIRYGPVENLWWIPLVVWHVVLSTVASLIIHRYAAARTSTFLRWQAIGFVALVGWGLTLVTGFSMDCLIHGRTLAIEQFFSFFKFILVIQFVAAVFTANVLYGTAIQAAIEDGPGASLT